MSTRTSSRGRSRPPSSRSSSESAAARTPLSRQRIVAAALALVDASGVASLSMRTVATALGVEAMSLYRHVADKDDLLLGIVDAVLAEIEVPPRGTPWRSAMTRRARSARDVFLRHPAAAIIVESCATMTPARLAYADAIIGLLMADGFDATHAYRGFLLLDSYIYGFTMQELSWPRPKSPTDVPVAIEVPPDRFPHFAAVMTTVMRKVGKRGLARAYADEFDFGLELVLDALAQTRKPASANRPRRRG